MEIETATLAELRARLEAVRSTSRRSLEFEAAKAEAAEIAGEIDDRAFDWYYADAL